MPDGQPRTTVPTQRAVQWTIFFGATAFVVYLCVLILGPFIDIIAWSSILAVAFHPVYTRLVRATGRASLSAFACSMVVVVVILLPLLFITGLAIDQAMALRDRLTERSGDRLDLTVLEPVNRAYAWIAARLGLDPGGLGAWMAEHVDDLGRALAQSSLAVAASVTSLVASFVFTIFAVFLLFRDGERIVARVPDLLPFARASSEAMLARIQDAIYASLYGVVVIALIQGALCGFIFGVLGIPSPALWGMVTALTSVLPVLGAAAVWVPGTVYLLVSGDWPQAIVLAVFGTAVISGVDNFLRPKLVGGRVGLNELVIFFALLGGLRLFGALGIILGPVLFAIAASILNVLRHESAGAEQVADAPRNGPTA